MANSLQRPTVMLGVILSTFHTYQVRAMGTILQKKNWRHREFINKWPEATQLA